VPDPEPPAAPLYAITTVTDEPNQEPTANGGVDVWTTRDPLVAGLWLLHRDQAPYTTALLHTSTDQHTWQPHQPGSLLVAAERALNQPAAFEDAADHAVVAATWTHAQAAWLQNRLTAAQVQVDEAFRERPLPQSLALIHAWHLAGQWWSANFGRPPGRSVVQALRQRTDWTTPDYLLSLPQILHDAADEVERDVLAVRAAGTDAAQHEHYSARALAHLLTTTVTPAAAAVTALDAYLRRQGDHTPGLRAALITLDQHPGQYAQALDQLAAALRDSSADQDLPALVETIAQSAPVPAPAHRWPHSLLEDWQPRELSDLEAATAWRATFPAAAAEIQDEQREWAERTRESILDHDEPHTWSPDPDLALPVRRLDLRHAALGHLAAAADAERALRRAAPQVRQHAAEQAQAWQERHSTAAPRTDLFAGRSLNVLESLVDTQRGYARHAVERLLPHLGHLHWGRPTVTPAPIDVHRLESELCPELFLYNPHLQVQDLKAQARDRGMSAYDLREHHETGRGLGQRPSAEDVTRAEARAAEAWSAYHDLANRDLPLLRRALDTWPRVEKAPLPHTETPAADRLIQDHHAHLRAQDQEQQGPEAAAPARAPAAGRRPNQTQQHFSPPATGRLHP